MSEDEEFNICGSCGGIIEWHIDPQEKDIGRCMDCGELWKKDGKN